MKQYDRLAKFYDRVISGKEETAPYVISRLRKFHPGTKTLLELGCGTGDVLSGLISKFEVSGIDSSKEMLRIAKQKLHAARLYSGDIVETLLPEKFDAAICVYDTINHLTSFNKWKRLFDNVHKMLNDEGVFIFDVNSVYKLRMLEQVSPLIHKFEKSFLIMDVNKTGKDVYNWNLKIFENMGGDKYELTESNIPEAVYGAEKILSGLEKRFYVLKIEEESGARISDETERIYFICRKKS